MSFFGGGGGGGKGAAKGKMTGMAKKWMQAKDAVELNNAMVREPTLTPMAGIFDNEPAPRCVSTHNSARVSSARDR